MAWCAPWPLFSSTLYSFTPVAATTARHRRGSTRPTAAADSSDRRSRLSAGSFGTTRTCPSESGLISRNARTFSSSYTLLQGISPRTILPNTVSTMGRSSQGLELSRALSLRRVAARQGLYEFACRMRTLFGPLVGEAMRTEIRMTLQRYRGIETCDQSATDGGPSMIDRR